MSKTYPIANETEHRKIWCPQCCRVQPRTKYVTAWINPRQVVVCYYGVCSTCAKVSKYTSEDLKAALLRTRESNLLRRYPQLKGKLER